MEAAISNIINLHFGDPEAYDVEGAPFQIQIRIAKALIGPTPDDGVWNYRQSFQRASELVGAFVNRLHKRRNRN